AVAPATASARTTRWPAAAATWAIPVPIAPAPTTPTVTESLSTCLSALERRLPFFEECMNSFRVVLGASGLPLQLLLEIQLLLQVEAKGAIEATFRKSEAARRHGGELSRNAGRRFEQIFRLGDHVHEPPVARLFRRHLLGEHGHHAGA